MTKVNQGSVWNFLSRYFPRKYPTIGDRARMNGIDDKIPIWRHALTLFGSFSVTHWPPRRSIEPGHDDRVSKGRSESRRRPRARKGTRRALRRSIGKGLRGASIGGLYMWGRGGGRTKGAAPVFHLPRSKAPLELE